MDFQALASGSSPLVFLPAGVSHVPAVSTAMEKLLLSAPDSGGLTTPDAWEDLIASVGTRGDVFVVDRSGERWKVLDIEFDPGAYTGRLRLLHQGRVARYGPRLVDLHEAYGFMLPIVVYKQYRYKRNPAPCPPPRSTWSEDYSLFMDWIPSRDRGSLASMDAGDCHKRLERLWHEYVGSGDFKRARTSRQRFPLIPYARPEPGRGRGLHDDEDEIPWVRNPVSDRGRYRYVHSCKKSDYESISDLKESAQGISMRTFAEKVGPSGWRFIQDMLGYDRNFPISRDWHVAYYSGVYRGQPAVFLVWSGVEYIFTRV